MEIVDLQVVYRILAELRVASLSGLDSKRMG